MKSQGISSRIYKVNQQLQKLASLIRNDQNLYSKTKEVLQQFREEQSSEDSLNYFEIQNQLAQSKGFNNAKIQVVSNLSEENQSNIHGSTVKSGLSIGIMKQSKVIPESQHVTTIQANQSKNADVTIKKFRPIYSPHGNKKQSQQKIKQHSRIKNSKSENKVINLLKNQSAKKNNTKKSQKQFKKLTQPFNFSTQLKGVYKKMKTSQNIKTTSQNRLNQSLKMHINLKKQVNLKITDLNIQKQQCQKQAQYLKSVMKVEQQQKLLSILDHISKNSEQSALMIFMGRILINFFSQFFNQKLIENQECTCQQLQKILIKKNYLIRYMLKLPDILKKDNTLCQQRCKKLFEQKYFIDHRINTHYKNLLLDVLYHCIDNLNNLISFLINNNVIKQTKRKMLPYQFNSQRSARNNNNINMQMNNLNTNMNIQINMNGGKLGKSRQRQYDSDRKITKQKRYQSTNNFSNNHSHANQKNSNNNIHNNSNTYTCSHKTGLKRTSTQKILSPKNKIIKGYKQK